MTFEGRCYIYSYPYELKFYKDITNNFPGGLFRCVREISLYDERPFEHAFFLRIAQSFPLVEKLTLFNKKSQNDKQYRRSEDNNSDLSIVEYPRLTKLELNHAHDDYVDQFLDASNMYLPNIVDLYINYQPLESITHNFTRDVTRINCTKLNYLRLNIYPIPKHCKDYFPGTEIVCLLPILR